ncbi:hypothetical protein [Clostridium estertheticum]|uniref:hypothetical protein n=1 Tax=Clostridium estertheticum TaxID=238834 RepID=UPI001C0E3AEB|nr:hypothetical protein [Clostridium estertheticum]MBU3173315.1 hypothetical protein [Clostridium estertheticum]
MLEKLVKFLNKNKFEVKKSNGGGLLVFAKWDDRVILEKYIKKIKIQHTTRYSSDYEYEIFSIDAL